MEAEMLRKFYFTAWLFGLILLASCGARPEPLGPTPVPQLGNPASIYCEQQGNGLQIVTAADGSQSGLCIFPNSSSCDEWAYFRGECGPDEQTGNRAPTPTVPPVTTLTLSPTELPTAVSNPTAIPTPRSIDPTWYEGWWTYTEPVYGFSLRLPSDWVVDESTTSNPLMNGHLLNLHLQAAPGVSLNLRVTFRKLDEDFLLWPTGVGAGSFAPLGSLDVAGQPARRIAFVCPAGQVNEVWYQDGAESGTNIQRGVMEFGFILGYTSVYCQEGYSLGGKDLLVGDMIVASLTPPVLSSSGGN
jgi:putative hemolysin